MIEKFNPDVHEKLKSYVYRLVDPRNGKTFYVGKGKGDRVFQHANAVDFYFYKNSEIKPTEETDDPAKIRIIAEIKRKGLEIIHIIQRWGMSDSTALEVESAFIDYFGLEHLSNRQKGHAGERGMRWTDDLNNELSAKPFDDYNLKDPTRCPKFILIKINDHSIRLKNGDIYEAVRAAWPIVPQTANKYPYVLAVRYGIVIGVYRIDKNGWKKTADGKRAYFDGSEAPDEIKKFFIDKRIPDRFRKRGSRAPVMYCDGNIDKYYEIKK